MKKREWLSVSLLPFLGVTVLWLATTGSVNARQADGCRSDPSARSRIQRALSSLDAENSVRISLEHGAIGEGKHERWMDDLQHLGIQTVTVDVWFVWESKLKELQATATSYSRKYLGPEIDDIAILNEIRTKGLEAHLIDAALAKARNQLLGILPYGNYNQASGTLTVFLWDDECIPDQQLLPEIHDINQTDLMRAAHSGNLLAVKNLIARGATLTSKDHNGLTALMHAIEALHPQIAETLIEAGAEVNDRDRNSVSPLMLSARLGETDVVKALVEHGANVDDQDNEGRSALMEAAGPNIPIEVTERLLAASANPNLSDKSGMTALMFAAMVDNTEAARSLLAAGAHIDAKNGAGETAMAIAKRAGSTAIADLLLDSGSQRRRR